LTLTLATSKGNEPATAAGLDDQHHGGREVVTVRSRPAATIGAADELKAQNGMYRFARFPFPRIPRFCWENGVSVRVLARGAFRL